MGYTAPVVAGAGKALLGGEGLKQSTPFVVCRVHRLKSDVLHRRQSGWGVGGGGGAETRAKAA